MKAGTIVTASKSLFSTHAANPDILFTFKEMTRCLKKMDLHLMSMCMTIMKIHQNQLSLSSAGMPPALLHRSGNGKVEELLVKGMPLGTFDDFPYEMKDTTLNPGDTILLMSDGLPELFNADKEMFGYERISEIFAEHAGHPAEDIIRELTQAGAKWVNEEDPQDDVTFVVLRLK
jgi:sigma-B regulation protein RsbU (phosphoserine phosphatase)